MPRQEDLIRRGLRFDQGLLCMIDGAKGFSKAVKDVFGAYVEIQRCCYHKRENVVGHLKKKEDQRRYRQRLQTAYREPDYHKAKQALLDIHADLAGWNNLAANSLMEGMEETLTLQRLGVAGELGQSLRTTNCMENLNSRIGDRLRNVKRWVNTDQLHRWMAMALTEIEPKLHRIPNAEYLPKLRAVFIYEHMSTSTTVHL